MGAVISLFHSKLEELKQRYPLFKITATNHRYKIKGKELVYHYCADLSEETAFFFNVTKEELSNLDQFHFLANKIIDFNKDFSHLKVYIEDPNTVWIVRGNDRSPVFADFADYGNEEGKQKFKQLNERAWFVKTNKDYFVCSTCHSIKEKSFLFSGVISGKTCVACAEVELSGIDC